MEHEQDTHQPLDTMSEEAQTIASCLHYLHTIKDARNDGDESGTQGKDREGTHDG